MDLQQILEELAVYCAMQTGNTNQKIKVVLPRAVIERFSAQFTAKEKYAIILAEEKPSELTRLHLNAGVVDLLASEETVVTSTKITR